jgi:hypothetical protein
MRANPATLFSATFLLSVTLSSPLHADPVSAQRTVAMHLQELVAQTTLPLQVDDTTVLVAAEASGNTLRYTFHLDDVPPKPFSLEYMRLFRVKVHCGSRDIHHLLRSGARYEDLYARPNGDKLGLVTVDQDDCEETSNAQ